MWQTSLIALFFGLFALTSGCSTSRAGPAKQGDGQSAADAENTADATTDGQTADGGPNPASCGLPQTSTVVSLPADDGVHSELVEWWYWVGHLQDSEGRWYGFQVTFFLFGDTPFRAQLANVAVVDVATGVHHSAAKFQFGKPAQTPGSFDFSLGAQSAKGGGGHDTVHAEMDGYVLDLQLDTSRRAVLQHNNGYQAYSFGGDTYYYSRPRMTAKGTLTVPTKQGGAEKRAVAGTSWFDHQWGDLQQATTLGWDWFALNLDDGRDVMAFVVHADGGDQLVGGSVTGPDCVTHELQAGEFAAQPLAKGAGGAVWTSPDSACVWPLGWQVTLQGEVLQVRPVVQAQEVFNSKTPTKSYWEGASTVVDEAGEAKGRGYVELSRCVTGG